VSAGVGRSVGTATVGGLPSTATVTTPGFGSEMLRVTNYADGALAAAGTGAEASTATRSGTVSYWTGSAYASISLSPSTSSTQALGPATATYAPRAAP
jgi:hypothetical protein